LECDPTLVDPLQPVCPPNFHFDQLDPTKRESLMKRFLSSFARVPRVIFAMLLSALFMSPPLTAEIIYNNPVDSNGFYADNNNGAFGYGYFGSSFSTTSSETPLSSISVYLKNSDLSATGNAFLRIYNTTYATSFYGSGYVPTGSPLGEASIDRQTITSAPITPTSANLYTFNFATTGSNAITLTANTSYAFMLETLKVGIWTNYSNPTSQNFIDQYFDTSNTPTQVYLTPSNTMSTAGRFEVGVAAVPEPSTYAMALAGLACGGYSLFRRRRAC
jgi:hypothetical protein